MKTQVIHKDKWARTGEDLRRYYKGGSACRSDKVVHFEGDIDGDILADLAFRLWKQDGITMISKSDFATIKDSYSGSKANALQELTIIASGGCDSLENHMVAIEISREDMSDISFLNMASSWLEQRGYKTIFVADKRISQDKMHSFMYESGTRGMRIFGVDYGRYIEDRFKLQFDLEPMPGTASAIEQVIRRGNRLSFSTIANAVSIIWSISMGSDMELTINQDIRGIMDIGNEPSWQQLFADMVGLEEVKLELSRLIKATVAEARISGNKNTRVGIRLALAGKPGMGKSTIMEIIAEALRQEGLLQDMGYEIINARAFIKGYVGHTEREADRVFDNSDLIVIDEIGGLLTAGGGDNFAQALVKKLVYFMETPEYRYKHIIIAGYESEIRDFLALDVGLESRIKDFVSLPDYNQETLVEIGCKFLDREGFDYEKTDVSKEISEFVAELEDNQRNARVVRNLAELIKRSKYVELYDMGTEAPSDIVVAPADVRRAAEKFFEDRRVTKETRKAIGFGV